MSFQALTAVETLDTPNAYVTLLLYVLGQWAGPDGSCFPAVETIADRMRCSTSQARKALAEAEALGFVRREERKRRDGGKSSNRIILTYCERADLADDLDTPGGHKRPGGRDKKAGKVSHPPLHYGGGYHSNTVGPPLPGSGAFLNQDSLTEESSDELSQRAGALDDVVREVWAAWPEAGREHSSERQVTWAVAAEVAAGAPLAEVRAGALAYAGNPKAHGQSGRKPKAPHTFLAEGRWKTHLPKAGRGAAVVAARIRFASEEVRNALVGAMGDAWVGSWLDPCGWDEGKRVIDPRLKTRADRLGETKPAGVLAELGVKVGKVG